MENNERHCGIFFLHHSINWVDFAKLNYRVMLYTSIFTLGTKEWHVKYQQNIKKSCHCVMWNRIDSTINPCELCLHHLVLFVTLASPAIKIYRKHTCTIKFQFFCMLIQHHSLHIYTHLSAVWLGLNGYDSLGFLSVCEHIYWLCMHHHMIQSKW